MEKEQYTIQKWMVLLSFGVLYMMVYYGRFSMLYHFEHIHIPYSIVQKMEWYIYSAIILSYTISSFFMGRIADYIRHPMMLILVGSGFSFLINMCTVFISSWKVYILLAGINSIFQSMIWINYILLIVMWWKSYERPLGCSIANFFSGLGHIPAFFLPDMMTLLTRDTLSVHMNFFTLLFLYSIVLLFFLFVVNPSEKFQVRYEEDNELVAKRERYLYEQLLEKGKSPIAFFLGVGEIRCWCIIAFLSSVCRYGLLEWIPLYYKAMGIMPSIDERFTNFILPLGMAFGAFVVTYITGKKFGKNKSIMVILCAALCGTLIVIFPVMPSILVAMVGIFCTGFFMFGINGIIWIYAMDRGGRVYSATLTGILNGFAYLGTFLQEILFFRVTSQGKHWFLIFLIMEFLCFIMVGVSIIASKKDTFVEEERE